MCVADGTSRPSQRMPCDPPHPHPPPPTTPLAEVRASYVDKVGAKMLDLFRAYWGAMERLEVGGWAGRRTGMN